MTELHQFRFHGAIIAELRITVNEQNQFAVQSWSGRKKCQTQHSKTETRNMLVLQSLKNTHIMWQLKAEFNRFEHATINSLLCHVLRGFLQTHYDCLLLVYLSGKKAKLKQSKTIPK